MPASRSVTILSRSTAAALLASGAGLLVLLGYALSEVIANPGMSLADGYWIGRLPWTAIGVALAVIGATVAIGLGTAGSPSAGSSPTTPRRQALLRLASTRRCCAALVEYSS